MYFLCKPTAGLDAKQSHQVSAENRFLFRIAQERRIENEVDAYRPIIGIVCSIDHVTDADFGDQMSKTFLPENHRVDVELVLEILTGFFLESLAVGAVAAAA